MLELVHELYGVGLNISYLFIRLGTHLALAAEANRVSAIFTNRVYMYTDNCLMQTACRQAAPPPQKFAWVELFCHWLHDHAMY